MYICVYEFIIYEPHLRNDTLIIYTFFKFYKYQLNICFITFIFETFIFIAFFPGILCIRSICRFFVYIYHFIKNFWRVLFLWHDFYFWAQWKIWFILETSIMIFMYCGKLKIVMLYVFDRKKVNNILSKVQ